MDSCSVKAAIGFKGTVTGASGAPGRSSKVGALGFRCDLTGSGKMVYDAASDGATLTIGAGATATFDLTGGLSSPLGESIAAALAFGQVYSLIVIHDTASAASGIRAFDQTSANLFLGFINAGGKLTLSPGYGFAWIVQADKTGMTVAAATRKIDIINLDGVNSATVRVFIDGKVP